MTRTNVIQVSNGTEFPKCAMQGVYSKTSEGAAAEFAKKYGREPDEMYQLRDCFYIPLTQDDLDRLKEA